MCHPHPPYASSLPPPTSPPPPPTDLLVVRRLLHLERVVVLVVLGLEDVGGGERLRVVHDAPGKLHALVGSSALRILQEGGGGGGRGSKGFGISRTLLYPRIICV